MPPPPRCESATKAPPTSAATTAASSANPRCRTSRLCASKKNDQTRRPADRIEDRLSAHVSPSSPARPAPIRVLVPGGGQDWQRHRRFLAIATRGIGLAYPGVPDAG